MKSEPTPSDRDVLAGLVERVTYHNAENGFCVIRIKARGHRDLVTVVGHAAIISAAEWIDVFDLGVKRKRLAPITFTEDWAEEP